MLIKPVLNSTKKIIVDFFLQRRQLWFKLVSISYLEQRKVKD